MRNPKCPRWHRSRIFSDRPVTRCKRFIRLPPVKPEQQDFAYRIELKSVAHSGRETPPALADRTIVISSTLHSITRRMVGEKIAISNNVGEVKHYARTLLPAPVEERHFALVDGLRFPTLGPLLIVRGQALSPLPRRGSTSRPPVGIRPITLILRPRRFFPVRWAASVQSGSGRVQSRTVIDARTRAPARVRSGASARPKLSPTDKSRFHSLIAGDGF
jgi:hypothetical protein